VNLKLIGLSMAVFLTGCSILRPIPVAPKVIEVQVPVTIPCITYMPAKPELYTAEQLIELPDDLFILQFGIDRLKRDIYISELEAVLQACQ
jgi:hypothetical protein